MIPHFNVCVSKSNEIVVTDLTKEADEYLPEEVTSEIFCTFKYSETITINIIQLLTLSEEKYILSHFNEHCGQLDEDYITLIEDGNYRITHIILPNEKWLKRQLETGNRLFSQYQGVYFAQGNSVYKYSNGEIYECDIKEVLEINTYKTTISRTTKLSFFILNLQKCFINLCNSILQRTLTKCKPKDIDDLIFKRDFIWMTINVIKYYIEFGQNYEAQRILEDVNFCQGFCKNNKSINSDYYGCGCS